MTNDMIALTLLSDPTRRGILDALAERPCNVRQLTDIIGVSQPAVSQHLSKLKAAQLVSVEAKGASNVYSFDPAGLAPIREMLDRYWGAALTNYARLANTQET